MKRTKRMLMAALLLISCLGSMAQKRSDEAQYLLNYLHEIYGKKMLSGVTACVNWNTNEAQWVYQHTGRWPAINQFDFIHHMYSAPGSWINYSDASVAIDWAREGGIVGAMWHWQMTTNDGSGVTCTPGTKPNETSFRPKCVRDPESDGYKQMVKDIDIIASYLKVLKQEGIPVIWRPLHEAQGNWTESEPGTSWHHAWFWWGIDGPEVFVDLWRFMYDRLVNHHGLDNLIWVFTIGDSYRWYPGDEYVDIVGHDLYNLEASKMSSQARVFKNAEQRYAGKPLAMSECGNVADLSRFWTAGSHYLYFCPWYDHARTNNTASADFKSEEHASMNKKQWEANISQDFVLMRDQVPYFLKTIDQRTTLWEGRSKQDWKWNEMLLLSAEKLKDIKEGDYLSFGLSENNNGWITFHSYPSKSQIESKDLPETSGFHPRGANCSLKLTADLVRQFKNGVYVYGGGYTLNRVEHVTRIPNPNFPADLTAINTPTADSADSAKKGIFTLSGIRISRITRPGIYIIDGKLRRY